MDFNIDEINELQSLCSQIRNASRNCRMIAYGIEEAVRDGVSGTECYQALTHIESYLNSKVNRLCELCKVPEAY